MLDSLRLFSTENAFFLLGVTETKEGKITNLTRPVWA